jgi:hypothetical protein
VNGHRFVGVDYRCSVNYPHPLVSPSPLGPGLKCRWLRRCSGLAELATSPSRSTNPAESNFCDINRFRFLRHTVTAAARPVGRWCPKLWRYRRRPGVRAWEAALVSRTALVPGKIISERRRHCELYRRACRFCMSAGGVTCDAGHRQSVWDRLFGFSLEPRPPAERRNTSSAGQWSRPMLAEAFMLRLEATLRNADEQGATSREKRFVPVIPFPKPPAEKLPSRTEK